VGHSFQDALGSVLPCLDVLDWVLQSLNEQDLVLPCLDVLDWVHQTLNEQDLVPPRRDAPG